MSAKMIEEYRVCEWCGEDIEQGRSDKKYCDKACSNAFYNFSFKKRNLPIEGYMKLYRKSYMALKQLLGLYGVDSEVDINEAISLGFSIKTPYLLLQLKGRKGTYNQIGNLVYQVSDNRRFIKIYRLND